MMTVAQADADMVLEPHGIPVQRGLRFFFKRGLHGDQSRWRDLKIPVGDKCLTFSGAWPSIKIGYGMARGLLPD